MFTPFLTAFNALVKNIKENPFATVMGILFLIVIYIMTVNSAKIDNLASPSPTQERHMLETSLKADAQINDELSTLRSQTGAARAVLRQFTNGTHNLAGVPYSYVVTTHVSARSGISAPSFDKYPVGSMNHQLRSMWSDMRNPKCIIQNTDEMENDAAYRSYLEQHGVKKLFTCPLTGIGDYPMGIIGIGFMDERNQKLSDEATLALVDKVAIKSGGFIEAVRYDAEPKKPWWQLW